MGTKGLRHRWMQAKVGSAGGRGANSDQQRAHCTEDRENTSNKGVLEAPGVGRGWCGASLCSLLKSPQRERAAHQNGDPVVIEGRRRVLDQLYPLGEEEEGEDSCRGQGGKRDGKEQLHGRGDPKRAFGTAQAVTAAGCPRGKLPEHSTYPRFPR